MVIASRLNTVFQSSNDRGPTKSPRPRCRASPSSAVFVPPNYRHNHGRFLMVARLVPLVNVGASDPYRKKLEAD